MSAPTFRDDASRDFGRLVEAVPAAVRRPTNVDELAALLRALQASGTPYKLRGAGHTASGEVLHAGGVVIVLTALAGIVRDDPHGELVTVCGGTTWLAVWEHLAAQGRRPLSLTDNLRVTVAGTLAVGGIGDASHLHGPQVAGVRRLLLVTPDGERHAVAAGDALFDHALCGHGQLGVIAEVTLATVRQAPTVHGQMLHWPTLDAYLAAAETIVAHGWFDYVRARLTWNDRSRRVWAVAAWASPERAPSAAELAVLGTTAASPIEAFDLLAHARVDPSDRWTFYAPCAELVLPWPEGRGALARLDAKVERSPLWPHLARGASIALVPGTHGLPLSPLPFAQNLLLALRPEPTTLRDAVALQPVLRELADDVLAAGGRVYLSSFPLDHAGCASQLGAAATALTALKRAHDPRDLCNAGAWFGWRPGMFEP